MAEVLPAHVAETISSSKAQHRLGKLVNRVRYERYVSSRDQLPETKLQRGTGDSQGEKGTRGLAKARQRSQSEPGATTFLRARPVDAARVIPASEFVTAGRRSLGIEEFVAARCPCCGAAEGNTRHACLCRRSGAQVNQHQPLVHALSRTFKSMSIRHQAESGAPFHINRDFRMDIVIEAGGLRDTTASEYRNKAMVLDTSMRTHRRGSKCGQAALTDTGQLSFDERSCKLATLAVESFGRFGKEGGDLIDQVTTSIVGGKDGWSLSRKGVSKERLFQIISVATQVTISRRVKICKLALRD